MERAELARHLRGRPGAAARTRIATDEPARFMADFADAVAGDGEIFLANPRWGAVERAQVDALLAANPPGRTARGWLMVPTGGTSGGVRFARHDSDTLGAAIGGFARHFALSRVNAVGLLPLFHVSGLMAWLRCAATEGTYLPAAWKEIEAGQRPELAEKPDGWVLSLVPTQLERLLRDTAGVEWLRRFQIVFLGGAPAWPELLDRAATARVQLSLSYGLTETAAMVAALQPAEFLGGERSSGTAMPHARLEVDTEGMIRLAGESVFRGYFPGWQEARVLATDDVGALDAHGRLTVLGRRDGLIITGGEKVHPEEVEAVLRGTGEFTDVAVLGWPHPEWGQQLVAVYPAENTPNVAKVSALFGSQLGASKRPKLFVPLAAWPRGAAGKLDRAGLRRLLEAHLRSGGPALRP